jgi:hypothetical protein
MKNQPTAVEQSAVRGFFRIHITEGGRLVGDSGWQENAITNDGFNQYLVKALGGLSGSKQISYAALGTGTVPGAAAVTLDGEVEARQTVVAATAAGSKTLALLATFGSALSFVSIVRTLRNIGLFNSSSGGTLFGGNTYASSVCATNQQVEVSYNVVLF